MFRPVHSPHHEASNNYTITKWHPFKISEIINKSSEIQKAVLTIWRSHDICHFKAATSQNFALALPTHTLSIIPIGCHAPTTNFSVCSLVLKFNDSLYIHRDYLSFHIFAFINLTCFSSIKITW